jgi:hypothetical protein
VYRRLLLETGRTAILKVVPVSLYYADLNRYPKLPVFFAQFTLSEMTRILLPHGGIRMTANGLRMTAPTSFSATR